MDLKEAKDKKAPSCRHPWETARLEVIFYFLKKYLPDINDNEYLCLDIGCGDTFFIEQLSKRMAKSSFYGIDTAFNDRMIHEYNNSGKANNIRLYKSLESAGDNINKHADIVLLLDVLEHIEDDISFLKWFRSSDIITDNTLFIITAPAFQSLFCSRDEFLEHYRRYTNKSLKSSIDKSGFVTISSGYFFTILLKLRCLQVFLEKIKKPVLKDTQVGTWNQNRFLNNFLKKILIIDFNITLLFKKTGVNIPGLSNYVICKISV